MYHIRFDSESHTSHIFIAKKTASIFQVPFEVSVNGRYKELAIPYNATWEAAQILIGKKMLRDPEALSLGYINPSRVVLENRFQARYKMRRSGVVSFSM
jgi:hypothetical protein